MHTDAVVRQVVGAVFPGLVRQRSRTDQGDGIRRGRVVEDVQGEQHLGDVGLSWRHDGLACLLPGIGQATGAVVGQDRRLVLIGSPSCRR